MEKRVLSSRGLRSIRQHCCGFECSIDPQDCSPNQSIFFFFLISVPFANCWPQYFSIALIHSILSHSLFLLSLYHQACHSTSEASSLPSPCLLSLLKYDWACEWQMNFQSECTLSPSPLSAALHLSPQATHSASPPLFPLLSPHTHCKL